jgi:Protein of unknown function (DUF3800)
MKLDRGSSPFFSIAVVVFTSLDDADACREEIVRLRTGLAMGPRAEFHFHRDSHERRLAFLSAVGSHQFRIWAFTLNKAAHRLSALVYADKNSVYRNVCQMALENASDSLSNTSVVIDGSSERTLKRELSAYLRARVPGVSTVTTRRSQAEPLLQLADYAVGVTYKLLRDERGAQAYFGLIRRRFEERRVWPS